MSINSQCLVLLLRCILSYNKTVQESVSYLCTLIYFVHYPHECPISCRDLRILRNIIADFKFICILQSGWKPMVWV